MATNIIYKGEKVGTQVDFQTGSLTDISTFTGDVRGAAIQDQIVDGVTDIGASQDAIHAMSGYLAANAHPTVTPASDVSIDNSNGTVLQDATFTFDDDGHVTEASFVSANLDDRYFTESEVTGISGALQSQITSNDGDITTVSGLVTGNDAELVTLRTATGSLNTRLTSAENDIDSLETATGSLNTRLTSAESDIDNLETSTGNLNTRLTSAENDIDDLETATGNLNPRLTSAEADIDALQAASGNYLSLTLDDVCDNDSTTDQDIQVNNIRVDGGNITGPATIVIDPDAVGASGTVVIQGDLQVEGTTTTINSVDVQVGDKSLILGTGAANDAAMDGGGIILSGTAGTIAEFTYDGTNDRWTTNGLDIEADIVGNADTASRWETARTITLGGDLGGSTSINGSSDVTLTATIQALSVEGSMLALDSVSGVHIADDQIDSEHYVAGSIDNEHIADLTIQNGKLANSSIGITAGSGILGGGSVSLGSSAELNVNTDNTTLTVISDAIQVKDGGIDTTQLAADAVDGTKIEDDAINSEHYVAGSIDNEHIANLTIQNGKLANSSVTINAGNGLNTTSASVSLGSSSEISVVSDQGHLDEIELGSDDNSITNVVTKGGILILRGTDNNGITTDGTDANAIDLNDKTTVAFEGVVQSARTDQDSDYVAMWKIQGVIRRDADGSTNMLQSFVTKTFAGANASAYGLSVSVSGNGLKINSDQNTANLITSATINYNWIEDVS